MQTQSTLLRQRLIKKQECPCGSSGLLKKNFWEPLHVYNRDLIPYWSRSTMHSQLYSLIQTMTQRALMRLKSEMLSSSSCRRQWGITKSFWETWALGKTAWTWCQSMRTQETFLTETNFWSARTHRNQTVSSINWQTQLFLVASLRQDRLARMSTTSKSYSSTKFKNFSEQNKKHIW